MKTVSGSIMSFIYGGSKAMSLQPLVILVLSVKIS